MRVPEMFSDHEMFMFLYALMEMFSVLGVVLPNLFSFVSAELI